MQTQRGCVAIGKTTPICVFVIIRKLDIKNAIMRIMAKKTGKRP